MQRRYYMSQRPSVNFWLLLAITALVNVAILSSSSVLDRSDSLESVFYGSIFGQLCDICIWSVFSTRPAAMRWLFTSLAIAAAALATMIVEHGRIPIGDALGLNAAVAATTIIALWIYKLVLTLRNRNKAATTQFSLRDLFVLTTSTALLAAIFRSSQIMRELPLFVTFFILTNVIVAVACLVFWSRPWHALLRLGATWAVAIASGWCLTFLRTHLAGELEVMFCIQSLIIFLWLEIGDIIPGYRATSNADGEAPALDAMQ